MPSTARSTSSKRSRRAAKPSTTASSANRPAVATLGDTIKNGRRGSLSGTLTVKGVQGHIAYPHLAKNPIHLAAPAIAELAATAWDEGNEYFPPTTWQISNIHGGTGATNVMPGTRRDHVQLPLLHREHAGGPAAARVQPSSTGTASNYEIDWTLGARPFLTQRGPLVDAATAAIQGNRGIDTELSTTGGTSDGRFIADICPQVVEFGPVNATIHKIDECVAVADLTRCPRSTGASSKRSWSAMSDAAVRRRTGHRARLLRFAVSRFNEAGLFFGHGTDNA